MKKIIVLLFIINSLATYANKPDDKAKSKGKKSTSSCCSYDEFAKKNKRTKPSSSTNTNCKEKKQ